MSFNGHIHWGTWFMSLKDIYCWGTLVMSPKGFISSGNIHYVFKRRQKFGITPNFCWTSENPELELKKLSISPSRNSNSTRNNGPRGLKFCMQPHQAKLTTTQHNFNPTIFWGGVIYRPPWVNPTWVSFDKEKFGPNSFWPKFFFTLKIFVTQKFF